MSLTASDFANFWREVHHPDASSAVSPTPFPWQQQLVEHVIERGWPATLDIPTGLGKTTALDVAVFTLAMSRLDHDVVTLPRRIYMVIDRRVVVDQSFVHARELQAALARAEPETVTARVAEALRPARLAHHDERTDNTPPALAVGRMRGGVTWSWRWLDRPDQPAIIVGTVDQLGSRLLFGGYGVGRSIRPIDAALTGSDALVLVDEAHLARPFLTTVRDALRIGAADNPLRLAPTRTVVLSATTGHAPEPRLTIDVRRELEHDTAAKRLRAPKTLHTVEAKITRKRQVPDTARTLARVAKQLGSTHDVVAIVANTIAVARAAFDELRGDDIDDDDVVLITGRQRPIDRDVLWARWADRISAGRARQDGPTRYVVATQTIEVGADLDFSAMVTESASLDALAQRLGRLNRRGSWQDAPAVVVHPSSVDDTDPIYGAGRLETWTWLSARTTPTSVTPASRTITLGYGIDVSPLALHLMMRDLHADERDALRMPEPVTPVLFPWILERWTHTMPEPLNAPSRGDFLHGCERSQPTVDVVWRHGGSDALGRERTVGLLASSVDLLPPSTSEAMTVPIWAVRAWLEGAKDSAAAVSDVDAAGVTVDIPNDMRRRPPPALVVGDGETAPYRGLLRPGDTVVVPTWLGGADAYGWNPGATADVVDVADLAVHALGHQGTTRRSRRAVLRMDPRTLEPLMGNDEAVRTALDRLRPPPDDEGEGEAPEINTVRGQLEHLHEALGPHPAGLRGLLAETIEQMKDHDRLAIIAYDQRLERSGVGMSSVSTDTRFVMVHAPEAYDIWVEDRSAAGSSTTGHRVTLQDHHVAVAIRARSFAEELGLSDALVDAIEQAAVLHDWGKADPRFQQMLNGGVAPPMHLLAKSGMDPAKRWAFRRARELSGYPTGMRHEAYSAMVAHAATAAHPERELITHLVAAHHGRGRPLPQHTIDDAPRTYKAAPDGQDIAVTTSADLDWAQPNRFATLNARFGPWGLALLETIVRLADIGCSEEGS